MSQRLTTVRLTTLPTDMVDLTVEIREEPEEEVVPESPVWDQEEELSTLGAKGHLPRGYIEDTLRFFKQFTQKVSRGYMLGSFTMYPPL